MIGAVLEGFEPVRHAVPMLSIRTETDTDRRPARAPSTRACGASSALAADAPPVDYAAELKFDGLAINLRYEGGVLVQAATRGDGETGEDVTHTIRTIASIPLRAEAASSAPVLEVRGEVYMRRDDFEALNERQRELIAGREEREDLRQPAQRRGRRGAPARRRRIAAQAAAELLRLRPGRRAGLGRAGHAGASCSTR